MKMHNYLSNLSEGNLKLKFDIEQINSLYNVTITDVISWNQMQIRATKQELELLVDFINDSLDNKT
jgi:hypothetical protein